MHGRLKVRTSAEQAELKRQQRAKKLKGFQKLRDAILHKRAENQHDDEALALTTTLLESAPDFYTVWNFRRQVLESLLPTYPTAKQQEVRDEELRFLDICLQKNPKSYGVWHQRRWIMGNKHFDEAPWEKELQRCSKFLGFDARNFHCWDYRRHVVTQCKANQLETNDDTEFGYCVSKIQENFSNYSVWHYRSTLLKSVAPGDSHHGVSMDKMREELEEARTACYIDSVDQSAFLYQRWLLGRVENEPKLHSILSYSRNSFSYVALVFTQPVTLNPDLVTVNSETTSWNCLSSRPQFGAVWEFVTDNTHPMTIELNDDAVSSGSGKGAKFKHYSVANFQFQDGHCELLSRDCGFDTLETFSLPCRELLEEEHDQTLELLMDLEENEKKWPLLAMIDLFFALDPLGNREKIFAHIDSLIQIDPYRKGRYEDMRSTYTWRYAVVERSASADSSSSEEFSLSDSNLTLISLSERLSSCTKINLKSNCLRALDNVSGFLNVVELNLDDNSIDEVQHNSVAGLPKLRILMLRRNRLSTMKAIFNLEGLETLTELYLEGNPIIVAGGENADRIRDVLPYLKDG